MSKLADKDCANRSAKGRYLPFDLERSACVGIVWAIQQEIESSLTTVASVIQGSALPPKVRPVGAGSRSFQESTGRES
jgi:hypothetical protein